LGHSASYEWRIHAFPLVWTYSQQPRARRADQPTPMKVEQARNGLYPVSDTFLSVNNATSSVAQTPEYSTGVCNKTAISTTKINDRLQISQYD